MEKCADESGKRGKTDEELSRQEWRRCFWEGQKQFRSET